MNQSIGAPVFSIFSLKVNIDLASEIGNDYNWVGLQGRRNHGGNCYPPNFCRIRSITCSIKRPSIAACTPCPVPRILLLATPLNPPPHKIFRSSDGSGLAWWSISTSQCEKWGEIRSEVFILCFRYETNWRPNSWLPGGKDRYFCPWT